MRNFLKTDYSRQKGHEAVSRRNIISSKKLDQDEKKVLEAFASGKYKSALTDERNKQLAEAAENTFKKDNRDPEVLQRCALREGVPYQALVSSVLHEYVSGSLKQTAAYNRLKMDAQKRRTSGLER